MDCNSSGGCPRQIELVGHGFDMSTVLTEVGQTKTYGYKGQVIISGQAHICSHFSERDITLRYTHGNFQRCTVIFLMVFLWFFRYFASVVKYVRDNVFEKCLDFRTGFVIDNSHLFVLSHHFKKQAAGASNTTSWSCFCGFNIHDEGEGLNDDVRNVNVGIRSQTKSIDTLLELCPRFHDISIYGLFDILPIVKVIYRALDLPITTELSCAFEEMDEEEGEDEDEQYELASRWV